MSGARGGPLSSEYGTYERQSTPNSGHGRLFRTAYPMSSEYGMYKDSQGQILASASRSKSSTPFKSFARQRFGGNHSVKSLRSSYTGLYPQTLRAGGTSALTFSESESSLAHFASASPETLSISSTCSSARSSRPSPPGPGWVSDQRMGFRVQGPRSRVQG